MLRLAWLTDTHLNFLRTPEASKAFGEYLLSETNCDAVVVTGDISEAPSLERHLEELSSGVRRPLYFVLGNHDYYRGSFESVEKIASKFEGWLDAKESSIALSSKVGLVGVEGWYDGLYGNPLDYPQFVMSDWILTKELFEADDGVSAKSISDWKMIKRIREAGHVEMVESMIEKIVSARANLLKTCQERSLAKAELAKRSLEKALQTHEWVILATHYPPFEGATWHEGQLSKNPWLPWFSSKQMGDALLEVAGAHPENKILVLCGHTHSSGIYEPLPNLQVLTGEAIYGAPDVAGVLNVDDSGVFVTMKLNRAQFSMAPFAKRDGV